MASPGWCRVFLAKSVDHSDKRWCSNYALWTVPIQDGAPKIAKLPYFSGFMVDITIVNGGYNGF